MTALPLTRAAPGLSRALPLRILGNEAGKGLTLLSRRWLMVIMAAVSNGINYALFEFLIGGGHYPRALIALTLPALIAAAIAMNAALAGSGGIAEEINGGTLEQTRLSPASPQLQALARMGALGIEGLAAAIVLGIVLVFGVGLQIEPHAAVLLPVLLTIVDALGYGLIMTALVVRVPSIGAITHVGNMAIMAFGGMLAPISLFPHGLEIFARFIPTGLGVQAINTILAGHGLGATWSDHTLPWLLVHTAAVVTAGFSLYVINIRRAQREGRLSPR